MQFQVNPWLLKTSAPPLTTCSQRIPRASAWAKAYDSSSSTSLGPLINLAQGVPGAPPPAEFQRRLGDAAAKPETTQYGDLRGDDALREALSQDVNRCYGVREGKVAAGEIVVTAGANLAFYSIMVSLAQAGDELILPTPWYFNQSMSLDQLGIVIVPLVCDAPSFQPSMERAESLITSKTRAIVLVTPNNPTGAIYSDGLLHAFAALAKRHGIALVIGGLFLRAASLGCVGTERCTLGADETYREFLAPGAPPHTLFQAKDWRAYLVHIFSFSKSYAIPGHRLGAVIASEDFLTQVHKTLDCLQICPARPAQEVVAWAIGATRAWREATCEEIMKRQEVFKELLEGVDGWDVCVGGGYFAYVKHPFKESSSELVASRLGSQVGIVVLPGTFFGPNFENVDDDRYIRFCESWWTRSTSIGRLKTFAEHTLGLLAIANVSIDTLQLVPARLRRLNEVWDSLPQS
ncbi:BQ2448_4183 [Microbotryum intermedium]|uniref:BQ2448_4183 protein n=1 Tax=Microbotryum intermedium TaxID=269621 RepID=A0A238FNI9_9BASI|nr:BQ2448_4183 [Microbotryum intermedium]